MGNLNLSSIRFTSRYIGLLSTNRKALKREIKAKFKEVKQGDYIINVTKRKVYRFDFNNKRWWYTYQMPKIK